MASRPRAPASRRVGVEARPESEPDGPDGVREGDDADGRYGSDGTVLHGQPRGRVPPLRLVAGFEPRLEHGPQFGAHHSVMVRSPAPGLAVFRLPLVLAIVNVNETEGGQELAVGVPP